jgi:Asp-tRNA(Asn)/Glu-tRNA(Gln) amidotransferase A subunit family amidase
MSDELTRLPAVQLAALIRTREVSPVEVVEAYLRRIEEFNSRLNAVVTLAPDAMERAREAEAKVVRGELLGALQGVPVTIKDTIDVASLRATSGSRVLAETFAREDAPSVARLRAAGAIILGKTNCSELALDYTSDNPVFGRTNNPHDLARTPGGSGGGCAAALSACLTAASLGSDLAGSIRIPAHFCGVAGLKPTAGRVNGDGEVPPMTFPYTRAASLGPLARTVEDVRLLFNVLADDANELETDAEFTFTRASEKLAGVRAAWYADDGETHVTPETREAVVRAASALQSSGLLSEESRPPGVEHALRLWMSLFSEATNEFVRTIYAGRETEAGPVARILLGRAIEDEKLRREAEALAWAERDRLRARLLEWMERTPLVVAPVGAVAAFRHEEAGRVEVSGQTVSTWRAFGYSQAFNVFDLPVACVPAGRTREGLPVGVQIVGRPFEEETVLAAARIVEEALGGWQAPSQFVAPPLPNAGGNPL